MRLLVVAGVHVAGLLLWWSDPGLGAPLVAGAVGAELVLGCRVLLLVVERRQLCVGLIASGAGSLALAAVRERARMATPRFQDQLARSIARLTARPSIGDFMPTARIPLNPRVLGEVGFELEEVGRLLRAGQLSVRATAMVEQLMSSPASPLYGDDADRLRREVGRVRYLA